MKKLTLTALVLTICLYAIAQQEKGDGQTQINLNYTKSGNSDGTFVGIYSYSTFLTKHAELGASYFLIASSSFTSTTISPFFNFNILSTSGKFVFYLGAKYDIGSTTFSGNKTGQYGLGGKVGVRLYQTESIFVLIEQAVSNVTSDSGAESTNFLTTLGFGILLKKKKA